MNPVRATAIRYIKLGAGGRWESTALERGRLEWGLEGDPHELMARGDWSGVHDRYVAAGLGKATASAYVSDAKVFYNRNPDTLWITFARGRMWWGFADPEIHWAGGDASSNATRHRVMLGGWRDRDIADGLLYLDKLSTRLTRLSAYQRTSCGLTQDQQRLCLKYINVEADAEQEAARQAKHELTDTLSILIQRLSWSDFETLVDLMLQRSGWARVSSLGGNLKDVDLIVEQPLTGERMAVQVKSSADQRVVDDYTHRLGQRPAGERLMLLCHSPKGTITSRAAPDGRPVELITGRRVAELVLAAGLTDWVIGRV